MDLHQLIAGLPIRLAASGDGRVQISAVMDDSRHITPGSLFVARAGHDADGRRFIGDATERGAVAVLASEAVDVPAGVAAVVCDEPGRTGIELAKRLHGDPASKLTLIGITGTNGKTTTAFMVRHLLNAAGRKCGLIGTIEVDDGGAKPQPADLTTPGAIELIGVLGRMVANRCEACVMEVSSHALDQGRVEPAMFDVAVFTNLTGDHLDYHKTMEAYATAKATLFAGLGEGAMAVVNIDDAYGLRMVADADVATGRTWTFTTAGRPGQRAHLSAIVRRETSRSTDCLFAGPWGKVEASLPLIGRHNAANLIGAIGAVYAAGIEVVDVRQAIETCPQVPGRLQRVGAEDAPFDVFVDYAHTDDALVNVIRALRPVTQGKLRVLFGCGGDRDKTKRPRMAKVACEMGDAVVITSDNPRTEDPAAIIADIVAGVPAQLRHGVVVEPDRAKGIARIIDDAEPGDVVLIAGKGHEDYQIIGKTKHHFDDREQAAVALAARKAKVG